MIEINCPSNDYKKFTFPAGELHLIIPANWYEEEVIITFNFSCVADIFELLLLCDTLKRNKCIISSLSLPYMPFAQADRVNEFGECFSLKLFCDLINNVIKPNEVVVHDPHSDVTPALLNNCVVVPQHDMLKGIVANIMKPDGINNRIVKFDKFYFICPDAGAAKKIHKLNKYFNMSVVMCEKTRNTATGEITGTKVYHRNFRGKTCIIIDDCCVGGRTFIEIAKILRRRNAGRICLVTTHGIYSKGIDVFAEIDEVWCFSKGRVK